jgi:phosphoribosylanthranilate isomerase
MSVLVKICGLGREQDVDAAVAAGADLVGFVLVRSSPRAVTLDRARELAARVPAGVRTVAVVERTDGGLAGFDLVQAYDHEGLPSAAILATRGDPPAEAPDGVPLLLDLPFGSRPGPDELLAHWRRAAAVRAPVVLAGSLTPDNVGDAVRAVRPGAVDTARGVETAPGVKDEQLIRRFVTAAREAL